MRINQQLNLEFTIQDGVESCRVIRDVQEIDTFLQDMIVIDPGDEFQLVGVFELRPRETIFQERIICPSTGAEWIRAFWKWVRNT